MFLENYVNIYIYTEISDLHEENCDCGTKSRILIDNAIKCVSNILLNKLF
jgi:hypothetical protein